MVQSLKFGHGFVSPMGAGDEYELVEDIHTALNAVMEMYRPKESPDDHPVSVRVIVMVDDGE